MSNNKNHNKFFKESEQINDETTIDNESINEEIITDNESVFGIVSGCEKLNVRKDPNSYAEVLRIINRGTEVQILEEYPDFYNVVTPDGIEGFCMCRYIMIKQ